RLPRVGRVSRRRNPPLSRPADYASLIRPTASTLPAIAQAGRDAVDGEVDALHHVLVGVAGAVALGQIDLHVIERIDLRQAVADGAGELRVAFEQRLLAHDGEQGFGGVVPLGAQP